MIPDRVLGFIKEAHHTGRPGEYQAVRAEWIARARKELQDRRSPEGGWSYRRGGMPAAEPTATAVLALLSAGDNRRDGLGSAGDWLAQLQHEGGSVPAVPAESAPGWTTPYAMLVWQSLSGYDQPRQLARDWLLRIAGKRIPKSQEAGHVLGHDPSLIGWPWVVGTHSWLEPTAMAILALRGEGLGDHPRARAGLAVVVDRAIPAGGWNYGNKSVFGQALRPQPGPTGLALLAMARGAPGDGRVVGPAIDYLRRTLPTIRAAASLGWGVLGLRAHSAAPIEAEGWLAEAADRSLARPDSTLGLGLLLMAASDTSPF